jgi:EmrB/QacA subfamily drug resistance transporter
MESPTPARDTATPESQQRAPIGVLFPALLLVMLLSALDQTIVTTALPTIVGEFGSLAGLSWVVTGYLLTSTIVLPLYGKLGDLYGRKIVLQFAIVIFLAGSALCGLARNMPELILLRALQGLGGGGLLVVTMAAIGDVVPPARRGRYQGMFGGVLGLATIVGPLLGGFLVQHLSWRWIFYINVPLGLASLLVIGATFHPVAARRDHKIDYPGAAWLALALLAIVLFTSQGGTIMPWTDVRLWCVLAAALFALAAFVRREAIAAEPILPPTLFLDRTFLLGCLIGFIVGIALFSVVTFVPLYLQVVKGVTPTRIGVQLLPMMGGIFVMSVVTGRLITRFGKYRMFPIAGTFLIIVALSLLSRITLAMPMFVMNISLGLFGCGLGMVLQVLVIAVQNALDTTLLGVGTSGVMLFRSIGGSIGVAVSGAIFTNRFDARMAASFPGSTGRALGLQDIGQLPPALHEAYLVAFSGALQTVFLVAACIAMLAFGLTWMLRDHPLREA